jgi:hypothetical protein
LTCGRRGGVNGYFGFFRNLIVAALVCCAILTYTTPACATYKPLPAELIDRVAGDLEKFFNENVVVAQPEKIPIAVATPDDETGVFLNERYSIRTGLQARIIQMENLRLLPSSRFDVLMAEMFPGRKLDSLTDAQFREFAAAAPVSYIVMSRIVRAGTGEIILEIRLRNALEGLMLYSPDYVIESAPEDITEEKTPETVKKSAVAAKKTKPAPKEQSAAPLQAADETAEIIASEEGKSAEHSEQAVSESQKEPDAESAPVAEIAGETPGQAAPSEKEQVVLTVAPEEEPVPPTLTEKTKESETAETETPVAGEVPVPVAPPEAPVEEEPVAAPATPEEEPVPPTLMEKTDEPERAETETPVAGEAPVPVAPPEAPVEEEPVAVPSMPVSGAATGTLTLPEQKPPSPKQAPASIVRLPKATPGKIEYFSGDKPASPAMDIAVFPIDSIGSPGLLVLTPVSLEVFKILEGLKMERVWSGKFKEKYTRRGLAGKVMAGQMNGKTYLIVTINKFDKSFLYEWSESAQHLEKMGEVSGQVANVMATPTVHLVSKYGKGVTTFSGADTELVDATGQTPRTIAFQMPDDYYSGCVRRWSEVSDSLSEVAVVTEDGMVQLYQGPRGLKAEAAARYGSALACGPATAKGGWLFVTTESVSDDAVVFLEAGQDGIVERWRTPGLGGAVVGLAAWDFDGDGEVEALGELEKKTGGSVFFRVLPVSGAGGK